MQKTTQMKSWNAFLSDLVKKYDLLEWDLTCKNTTEGRSRIFHVFRCLRLGDLTIIGWIWLLNYNQDFFQFYQSFISTILELFFLYLTFIIMHFHHDFLENFMLTQLLLNTVVEKLKLKWFKCECIWYLYFLHLVPSFGIIKIEYLC